MFAGSRCKEVDADHLELLGAEILGLIVDHTAAEAVALELRGDIGGLPCCCQQQCFQLEDGTEKVGVDH